MKVALCAVCQQGDPEPGRVMCGACSVVCPVAVAPGIPMRSDDVARLIVWVGDRARETALAAKSPMPLGQRADLVGAKNIAEACGISERTLVTWRTLPGAPIYGKGNAALVANRATLFEWILDRAHNGELSRNIQAPAGSLVALALYASR